MDISPKDKICYTIQYQEAFLKYVENKYFPKHRQMSVINPEYVLHRNVFPAAKASGLCQSSFD